MKNFNIIHYKECPQCNFHIDSLSKYAYDNNICPKCGYTTGYGSVTLNKSIEVYGSNSGGLLTK